MSTSIRWFQDSRTGQYYFWSQPEQCYIYQSGERFYPTQAVQSAPRVPPPQQQQPLPLHQQSNFHYAVASSGNESYTTARRPSTNSTASGVTLEERVANLTVNAGSSRAAAAAAHYSQNPISAAHRTHDWYYPSSNPPPAAANRREQHNRTRPVHKEIGATPGDYEKLDPRYRKRDSAFFKQGRVFKMHWAQPSGREDDDATAITPRHEPLPKDLEKQVRKSIIRDPRFGQPIFSKIRFFIVIKPGQNKCTCVPIVSYNGRGTAKAGVVKCEHAIAYTDKVAPEPSSTESLERDEKPLLTPIRIRTDEKGDKLAEMSRIDYGRIYTVEHNVKAMAFGWVHEDSEKDLQYSFLQVMVDPELLHSMVQARQRNRDSDDEDDDDDDDDDDDHEQDNTDNNAAEERDESAGIKGKHAIHEQPRAELYQVDVRAGPATNTAVAQQYRRPSQPTSARPTMPSAVGQPHATSQYHIPRSQPPTVDEAGHSKDEEDESDSDAEESASEEESEQP